VREGRVARVEGVRTEVDVATPKGATTMTTTGWLNSRPETMTESGLLPMLFPVHLLFH
jgi:hypothetical protein